MTAVALADWPQAQKMTAVPEAKDEQGRNTSSPRPVVPMKGRDG